LPLRSLLAKEFSWHRSGAFRRIPEQIQQNDPTGKTPQKPVNPVAQKYSDFQKAQISLYKSHPVPLRGALRNVPMRGGDAVDADGASDEGI
jgi:hypothetical protein